jgi:tRNA-2-methylthio-N6-dimethylallyladenosine synthase
MRAYVGCVGCEQRDLDAERVRTYLTANGFDIVSRPDEADISIVVTCAVDERNERASLAVLKEVARAKPASGRLVVGGCLPSISPDTITSVADATFSPRTLGSLDAILAEAIRVPMAQIPDPNCIAGAPSLRPSGWRSRARAEYELAKRGYKIRINHGCLLSCSYCVIRLATGRLESVAMESITAAFESALARNEATVMLVGGDTGAYGLDIGTDFASLLGRLFQYEGRHRIYIHDFNANWLLRGLRDIVRVLQSDDGRLRAASIPVQSGSDRVLKRMRRPYRADDIVSALRLVRETAPELLLGSHIIVGYPGETEEDFVETVAFLEKVDFDFVTCFRYSEHPAAPSAKHEGKVPEVEKHSRLERVRGLLGDSVVILE